MSYRLKPIKRYAGSQGQSYEVDTAGAEAYGSTTTPLRPHEGLTIVATWPEGFLAEPTQIVRVGWLLKDNLGLVVLLGRLAVLLAWGGGGGW